MEIRQEQAGDYAEITRFVEKAFETARVKDGTEQDFVLALRERGGYLPALALVAVEEGKIVGHIMLTKLAFELDGSRREALLLAPLSVALEYRSRGLGQRLMQEAFSRARELGCTAVFLCGDPGYYRRSGFRPALDFGIRNETAIPPEYVLAKELVPGALSGTSGTVRVE